MAAMKNSRPEIFNLKRDLAELGWNIRSWAQAFGYMPDTARRVVRRHWVAGTKPRGRMTRQVLADLRRTLYLGIHPEEMESFGFQEGGQIVEEIRSI